MNDIDYFFHLRSFIGSKHLNIFSTNYDLTIEKCFLKGISYTDGFGLYWNKDLFEIQISKLRKLILKRFSDHIPISLIIQMNNVLPVLFRTN